ncbi:MAG: hypothetical protein ACI95K_002146, partial [Lentimonas sp.]
MRKLIENIKAYVSLNSNEIGHLEESIEKKTYNKNDIIFTEGKIADKIY